MMQVVLRLSNSTPFDTIQHHMTQYIWCQDSETTPFNTRGETEEPSEVAHWLGKSVK